jgi:hypothetical protein
VETEGWQVNNAASLGVTLKPLSLWIDQQKAREASNALHCDMDRTERA